MYRRLIFPFLLVAVLFGLTPPAQTKEPPKKPPEKNSYLGDHSFIKRGYEMLKLPGLGINPTIDFRPVIAPIFAPRVGLFNLNVEKVSINFGSLGAEHPLAKENALITQQLQGETNEILRAQRELQQQQLAVLVEQAKTQAAQKQLGDAVFTYTQKHDEALAKDRDFERRAVMRKVEYPVSANRLIVVVADFSCGNTGEGVEIADEIATALSELRQKAGIDIEIIVGEIKPGVVIRNEALAQDVGVHFPKGTCYAVVWGTMSPRTVGKFRPHVTCVLKIDDERGVGSTYTIDPDSQPLPLGETPEEQRRDQHRQLVEFTCAVVPGCYISYALARDRKPELDRFYAYLGKEPELVKRYKSEVAAVSEWVEARTQFSDKAEIKIGKPSELRRMTAVSKEQPFPQLVVNTKDNSLMTLITERDKNGKEVPRRFKDGGDECLVYIDVAETTNRQFLPFLNDKGNLHRGGAHYINTDTDDLHRKNIWYNIRPEGKQFGTGKPEEDRERPVVNVSWWGASAYCTWAGKDLPTKEEWQAAAAPIAGAKFPWGDAADGIGKRCATAEDQPPAFPTRRIGSFSSSDRSRIGCLDMAGNVAEWCKDELPANERVVCGGDWKAPSPALFEIASSRSAPSVKQTDHIGFRGVVRLRIAPAAASTR